MKSKEKNLAGGCSYKKQTTLRGQGWQIQTTQFLWGELNLFTKVISRNKLNSVPLGRRQPYVSMVVHVQCAEKPAALQKK